MHNHDWYVSSYLLLALPDCYGRTERYTQWHCHSCTEFSYTSGYIALGDPLGIPEQWKAIAAREQRQQPDVARAAKVMAR